MTAPAVGLAVVLGVASALAGCGPLIPLGVIGAVMAASGGGGSGPPQARAEVLAVARVRPSDPVRVPFVLFSSGPEPEVADIEVDIQVSSGGFTPALGLSTTGPLAAEPNGRAHEVVWDPSSQLDVTVANPEVRVRVTPIVAGRRGRASVSAPFVVGNDAPTVIEVAVPVVDADTTTFAIRVTDTTSDPVQLALAFSVDGVALGAPTLLAPTSDLATSPSGISHEVVWLHSSDLGDFVAHQVDVRVVALDAFDGASAEVPLASAQVTSGPVADVTDVVVTERTGTAETAALVVTLSRAQSQTVTIDFATASGTAEAGADFVSVTGTLSIPAGALAGVIQVSVLGDAVNELREEFLVRLTGSTTTRLGDAEAVCTIIDDDVVRVDAIGTVVHEGAGPASVGVRLNRLSQRPIEIGFATRPGTALAGVDYVERSGSVVVPPGASEAPIDIAILDDVPLEPAERFEVVLVEVPDDDVFVGAGVAAVTIRDRIAGLRVTAQPSDATTGQLLSPAIEVTLADRDGNLVPFAAGTVSVSLPDTTGVFPGAQVFGTGTVSDASAVGDIDLDGRADLAVVDLVGNRVAIYLNETTAGSKTLAFREAAASVATGARPTDVALADLDGDGSLDVITANSVSDSVTVALHHPTAPELYLGGTAHPVADEPLEVAVADLDQDGRLDIVTSSGSLLRQDPASPGAFLPASQLSGPARSVAVADVDGDGAVDVVLASDGGARVLFQSLSSPGTFPIEANVALSNSSRFGLKHELAIADFDGDGALDLALPGSADNVVGVSLQTGPRAFGAAVLLGGGGRRPSALVAADLNEDGLADLVAGEATENIVSVFFADPSEVGGFRPPVTVASVQQPAIALGDVDADGLLDIITTPRNGPDVGFAVLLQDPALPGGFRAPGALVAGLTPAAIAARDLDGDGRGDLVIANESVGGGSFLPEDTVAALLSDASAASGLRAPLHLQAGRSPIAVDAGDLNGDQRPDLAAASRDSGDVRVYFQDASVDGGFGVAAVVLDAGVAPRAVAVGDLNADGLGDVAVAASGSGAVHVYHQDPSARGTFVGASPIALDGAFDLAIADLDGDGRLDLAVARAVGITVLLQSPGGVLTPGFAQDFAPPSGVAAGDLDGDGLTDLAVSSFARQVTLFVQDPGAPGTFATTVVATTAANADVAVGDVNDDGLLDVALANGVGLNDTTVSVLLQDPGAPGTFLPEVPSLSGRRPRSLVLFDLEGDGVLELAATNSNNTVSVFHQFRQPSPATLAGTTSVPVQGGVATFSDLRIGASGRYLLRFELPGLGVAKSAAIVVVDP